MPPDTPRPGPTPSTNADGGDRTHPSGSQPAPAPGLPPADSPHSETLVTPPTAPGLGAAGPGVHPAPAGATIPGYEITSIIGRGAMGVVYKARQTRLNRDVALKVLLAGAHASDEERARFRTEATTVAQLQHPHVIQVYDVGEHAGLPYLAAEYVSGGTMQKWLGGKQLGVEASARLIYLIARAVGAAHAKGIVHRDLKPGNILLTPENMPKVADFGLARQYGDATLTATGAVLGTPQYMAPEQAAGLTRRVGPPADVYALGVMLYECLTGRCPHVGDTVFDTIYRVRFTAPEPVRALRGDVPPELAMITERCLAKAPEQRFQTADELADALARFINAWVEAGAAPPPAATGTPPWLLAALAMIALALTAFVVAAESGLLDRLGAPGPKAAPTEPAPTPTPPNNASP